MLSISRKQSDSVDSPQNCPDSNDNEIIKCQVCNVSFDSLEGFQSHAMTPQHALKVMLKSTTISDINTIECKVQSTDEESILPELNVNKPVGPSYKNCQVCGKVFSGPEPYKQHLESQTHKKKVSSQQNLTTVGGNLTLKCEPCDKSFSGQVPYVQHMSSETHKKKLRNIQIVESFSGMASNSQGESGMKGTIDKNQQWFCSTCNVHCSGILPYKQHIEGSIHFKNVKKAQNQDNIVAPNSGMTSVMQVGNFSEGKIPELSESISQLGNGTYQKDNEERQNDFVLSEKKRELEIVSNEELSKLIPVILPNEKINFDVTDISKDSVNKKPDMLKQGENKDNENGFDNGFNEIMGMEKKI